MPDDRVFNKRRPLRVGPSVVNYMDLDEQKLSDRNTPLQLIKDSLAEMGK